MSFENVPAFVLEIQKDVETRQWGTVKGDIAFGGVFYALVDVDLAGLRIGPENARALAEAGIEIKAALKDEVHVIHPDIPGLDKVAYVMFRDRDSDDAVRSC